MREHRGSRIVAVTATPAAGRARASTIPAPNVSPRPDLVAAPQLRAWRHERAMPQQQLASAAGVDISTVQRLEAGGVARLSTIRKLADALGVEPRDLMAQPPAP